MIVSLDRSGRLHVEDPKNFNAFSFRGDADSHAEDGSVTFCDGNAWVSEAALRSWPPLEDDEEWQAGLTAMIGYARSKGWIDPDSGRIQAHIETG